MITVRAASAGDVPWMQAGFHAGTGWAKPDGYFAARVAEAGAGDLVVLVAHDGEDYLGHALVRWVPGYRSFRDQGIPEVQDLNVVAGRRRQGIGTQLLDEAERRIALRSAHAGIGVGLYAAYGPAQRLYVKRGYIPDGHGAVHDQEPLAPGRLVPVDDGLILYLIKPLRDDLTS